MKILFKKYFNKPILILTGVSGIRIKDTVSSKQAWIAGRLKTEPGWIKMITLLAYNHWASKKDQGCRAAALKPRVRPRPKPYRLLAPRLTRVGSYSLSWGKPRQVKAFGALYSVIPETPVSFLVVPPTSPELAIFDSVSWTENTNDELRKKLLSKITVHRPILVQQRF